MELSGIQNLTLVTAHLNGQSAVHDFQRLECWVSTTQDGVRAGLHTASAHLVKHPSANVV
jgi:hypothetical protein